jgi:transcriptional regulator with XRE-family HTH domain
MTPRDIPQGRIGVHHVYMPEKLKKPPELRWRLTQIRHWRDYRDMTQQGVADTLAGAPYHLKMSYASLGRLENGLQMPKIELIEALAKVYETDIDSMLNRLPTIPIPTRPDAAELAAIWDEASPEDREKIVAIAKTIVRGTRPK